MIAAAFTGADGAAVGEAIDGLVSLGLAVRFAGVGGALVRGA